MATNVEGVRRAVGQGREGVFVRLATETKHAFKTTEFWGMIAVTAGILLASWVIDADGGGGDAFPRNSGLAVCLYRRVCVHG